MEREEIACVAASYGVDFDQGKDVKMDIIKKLKKARDTGRGLLMITDERNDDGDNKKRKLIPDLEDRFKSQGHRPHHHHHKHIDESGFIMGRYTEKEIQFPRTVGIHLEKSTSTFLYLNQATGDKWLVQCIRPQHPDLCCYTWLPDQEFALITKGKTLFFICLP